MKVYNNSVGRGRMILMSTALARCLPALYATEDIPANDKIAQIKFFDPAGSWTWYAVESCTFHHMEVALDV